MKQQVQQGGFGRFCTVGWCQLTGIHPAESTALLVQVHFAMNILLQQLAEDVMG